MLTMEPSETHVLWGGALSLYTGKVRSYLIKKRIPYREYFPNQPAYWTKIIPALGFVVVPVLEAPDGSIYQDTSDIIEYLEGKFPEPCLQPSTPVQATVASLICAFGSEALVRQAMHYRWSYRPQQESFLVAEFGRCVSASHDPVERAAAAAPAMRAMDAYLPPLGVTPDTIPAIEQSYEALLAVLDAHFQQHPYILGGRPSAADFGLMAPLYAHLARDPCPSAVMKRLAPNVFRWTERMNLPDIFDGEFADREPAYPAGDAIPATLEPLLAHVFQDWGPELIANAAQYNAWLASNPGLKSGDPVSVQKERKVHPTVGGISFPLRGATIRCASAVQALWHFNKATTLARALSGDARTRFDALVRRTGGESAMAITLGRAIKRQNYTLVVA